MKQIGKLSLTLFAFFLFVATLQAKEYVSKIPSLPGENWYGGAVALGIEMPYASDTKEYRLDKQNFNNQISPLLVSSSGRYVWCDQPYRFRFENGTLIITSDYETYEVVTAGSTLRDAFLHAAKRHFPASGKIPHELFFSKPQYNTWIELMYNQNEEDILKYAHSIIANGFPAGILMIDDNWQRYYGNFDFKAERFDDPAGMIRQLHELGFEVMLWMCPYISADSPEFRDMEEMGYLLREKGSGETAVVRWWNGYSACLDVTNPEAVSWFKEKLRNTMERYGVDGFKFDAGDVEQMQGDFIFHDPDANAHVFSQKWAELGLDFTFNEYRASWKMGGEALVQRLGDKEYSWRSNELLIPDMITAGLLGYPYACPDMIGGGSFKSFLDMEGQQLDEEIIVRSCQIHSLMPMMQFSVAPWRVLSQESMEISRRYARLHEAMGPYILEYAKIAAKTNEPIVRSMEYQYPHRGFAACVDQYMLGDKYLVAPMTDSSGKRKVQLPHGRWKDDQGKTHRGPKVLEIDVPLERLPYYELLK